MIDEIFKVFNELKVVLTAFNERGKTEPEKLVEEVKVKIKELSEAVEKPEESEEGGE